MSEFEPVLWTRIDKNLHVMHKTQETLCERNPAAF